MLERTRAWRNRLHFPENAKAGLNFPAEVWMWDIASYESAAGIRRVLQRGTTTPDEEEVLYRVVRSLISDVIDAAGGVEHAYSSWCSLLAQATAEFSEWQQAFVGDHAETTTFAHPFLDQALYELHHLTSWARTLDERLERRPRDSTRFPTQGLIPAMAPGPRLDAVRLARDQMRRDGVHEARILSNLVLHMQPIALGTPTAVLVEGRIQVPFPDRVAEPVSHHLELTYASGRQASQFADGLMRAVEAFMNSLLEAFEANIPERMLRP